MIKKSIFQVFNKKFFIHINFLYIMILISISALFLFLRPGNSSTLEDKYYNSIIHRKYQIINSTSNKLKEHNNKDRLKWSFYTGEGTSSPAIGLDGTIYYGCHSGLYAFNSDGTLKWKNDLWVYPPPSISPDGTIYFLCEDRDFSVLYALSTEGVIKWQFSFIFSLNYDWFYRSSLAIDIDGTIYFSGNDYNLYAINPFGELEWKFNTGNWRMGCPAIGADGTIYFGSQDGNAYAINSDGTLKWKFFTGEDSFFSTAIDSDGTIYFNANENLYAINSDGSLKWISYICSSYGGIAIGSDGTIYLEEGGNLHALNPKNGTEKWKLELWWGWAGDPAVGSDGTIYFGSGNYNLYALNPDGSVKWKFNTGNYILSGPAIDSDGTIYFGSEDYLFYALNSDSLGLADSNWPRGKHDNRNTNSAQPNLTFFPPLNFIGNKLNQRSLFMQEYINILTWESNPLNEQNVVKYRIYQIDEQFQTILVELSSDTFEYFHMRVEKDKKYNYAIVGVDYKGEEGGFSYTTVK